MTTTIRICAGIFLAACIQCVQAQAFPVKALRLVVPYPPGGTTDVVARAIAPKLSELMGQQVVVENRGGAAGIIGTEHVAKSAPDGYTFMLAGFDFAANASLYTKLPYDAQRDFAPIALIATYPFVLVTDPALPVQSVKELIAFAKANPGRINYASAGNGSSLHLAGELFKTLAGVDLTHVPYKGGGPAIADLLAGQVQLLFISKAPVANLINSGRLKLLAVTGAKRQAALPDVATVQEGGVPGYEVVAWLGFVAPAGVPKPIVDRLNADIRRALLAPDVRERLASLGADLDTSSPETFGALLREEFSKWTRVVKSAGIKVD
jgi:tripartite-type tricarboxylate transporter receptor subunit TctC